MKCQLGKGFFLSAVFLVQGAASAQKIDCNALVQPFKSSRSAVDFAEPDVTNFVKKKCQIDVSANETHSVQQLIKNYKLSGAYVRIGVWDEGRVLDSHQELYDRIIGRDNSPVFSRHATHVAGTIASAGLYCQTSLGVVKNAKVDSYDWDNIGLEVCEAAKGIDNGPPLYVSNHSHGVPVGWDHVSANECRWRWKWMGKPDAVEDERFGKYVDSSALFDAIVFANPSHSMFVAAGNDRDDAPELGNSWNGNYCTTDNVKTWKKGSNSHPKTDRARKDGYDTISGYALAKNVITIGAVNDIVKGTNQKRSAADVVVTNFSSWGPADDGRIKPDVVANGFELESPSLFEGSAVDVLSKGLKNNQYIVLSGTSMGTPVAAGIGGLLNELSGKNEERKRVLRADEMKAVLVHTALSGGPDVGTGCSNCPSYSRGWGLIEAGAAGDLVAGKSGKLYFLRDINMPFTKTMKSNGGMPIRATLVWLDPAGDANELEIDNNNPTLKHDLDLLLSSPNNTRHFFPWSLDRLNPKKDATNSSKNSVDNVERIDLSADLAPEGEWTISVNCANCKNKSVSFALAVSGLLESNK